MAGVERKRKRKKVHNESSESEGGGDSDSENEQFEDVDNIEYLDFLKDFFDPQANSVNSMDLNDDEEADPEFRIREDEEEDHDPEELRRDPAVNIPKRELNILLADLKEIFDEEYDRQNEQHQEQQQNNMNNSNNYQQQQSMGIMQEQPSSSSYSSLRRESSLNTPRKMDALSSYGQSSSLNDAPNASSSNTTTATITTATAATNTDNNQIQSQPEELLFTPHIVGLIQFQLQQHIQQLAQTYVLTATSSDEMMKRLAADSKAMIVDLNNRAELAGPTSAFAVKNMKFSKDLINSFPVNTSFKSPIKKKILEERYMNESQIDKGDGRIFPRNIVKAISESGTFMYSELLPVSPMLNCSTRINFTINEDSLIAIALNEMQHEQYDSYKLKEKAKIIGSCLLPGRPEDQIFHRIKNARKTAHSKTEETPGDANCILKTFFAQKIIPPSPTASWSLDALNLEPIPPLNQYKLPPMWSNLIKKLKLEYPYTEYLFTGKQPPDKTRIASKSKRNSNKRIKISANNSTDFGVSNNNNSLNQVTTIDSSSASTKGGGGSKTNTPNIKKKNPVLKNNLKVNGNFSDKLETERFPVLDINGKAVAHILVPKRYVHQQQICVPSSSSPSSSDVSADVSIYSTPSKPEILTLSDSDMDQHISIISDSAEKRISNNRLATSVSPVRVSFSMPSLSISDDDHNISFNNAKVRCMGSPSLETPFKNQENYPSLTSCEIIKSPGNISHNSSSSGGNNNISSISNHNRLREDNCARTWIYVRKSLLEINATILKKLQAADPNSSLDDTDIEETSDPSINIPSSPPKVITLCTRDAIEDSSNQMENSPIITTTTSDVASPKIIITPVKSNDDNINAYSTPMKRLIIENMKIVKKEIGSTASDQESNVITLDESSHVQHHETTVELLDDQNTDLQSCDNVVDNDDNGDSNKSVNSSNNNTSNTSNSSRKHSTPTRSSTNTSNGDARGGTGGDAHDDGNDEDEDGRRNNRRKRTEPDKKEDDTDHKEDDDSDGDDEDQLMDISHDDHHHDQHDLNNPSPTRNNSPSSLNLSKSDAKLESDDILHVSQKKKARKIKRSPGCGVNNGQPVSNIASGAGSSNAKKRATKYNTTEMQKFLDADSEIDIEEIETAFAEEFWAKLQHAVDQNLYNNLVQVFVDFGDKNGSEQELFTKVGEMLKDFPELLLDFVTMVEPQSCDTYDLFKDNSQIQAQIRFMNLLEKLSLHCPQLKTRILQKLRHLRDLDKLKESDVMEVVELYFQGNQVMTDGFKALFPTIFRPETNVRSEDFEEINLDDDGLVKTEDGTATTNSAPLTTSTVEVVNLPEEANVPATTSCPCDCHQDTQNVSYTTKAKHCQRCRIRFQEGKVFMHCGRMMKQVNIAYTESKEKAEQVVTRQACSQCLEPFKVPDHPKRKSVRKSIPTTTSTTPVSVTPTPIATSITTVVTTSTTPSSSSSTTTSTTTSSFNRSSRLSSAPKVLDSVNNLEGVVKKQQQQQQPGVIIAPVSSKSSKSGTSVDPIVSINTKDIIINKAVCVSIANPSTPSEAIPTTMIDSKNDSGDTDLEEGEIVDDEDTNIQPCPNDNKNINSKKEVISPPTSRSSSNKVGEKRQLPATSTTTSASAPKIVSPSSVVPPSPSQRDSSSSHRKNPTVPNVWTLEEDRAILITCQQEQSLNAAFDRLIKVLPNRTSPEIRTRFSELMAILEKVKEGDGGNDKSAAKKQES